MVKASEVMPHYQEARGQRAALIAIAQAAADTNPNFAIHLIPKIEAAIALIREESSPGAGGAAISVLEDVKAAVGQ